MPPYHPQSNGVAERAVQTTKKALLKQLLNDEQNGKSRSLQHSVDNFLFSYRDTPPTFTGNTPAKLFLRRKLRTRLTLLRLNVRSELSGRGERVKLSADKRRGVSRYFSVGHAVLVHSVQMKLLNDFPEK